MLDRVLLRTLGAKRLPPWTLDLAAGTHALVLALPEAAIELTRVVCGIERPKRGRVFLGQEEPYRTPALRARIGSHFDWDFTGTGSLLARDFWSRVRDLRTRHGVITAEPIGLVDAARLALPIDQLTPQERREFELELALSIENPQLIWLSQPPRLATPAAQDEVLGRLRKRAADGAIVVVGVSTEREAGLWGDLRHPTRPAPDRESERTIQLVVERPREVAAELQRDTAVLGTEFDPARPNVLLVHGSDDLALRRACGLAVVSRRCELFEMVSVPGRAKPEPSLLTRAGAP